MIEESVLFIKKKTTGSDGETPGKRLRKLYEYIKQHPDDDSKSIRAALGINRKKFDEHIKELLIANKITERKDGGYRNYSVKETELRRPKQKRKMK